MKVPSWEVRVGDALERLREMPDESVQTCMTSPPYWGLRDYGHDDQIGLEETPEAYVERLVEVFGEVRRVLREDGTLWLNLGDSYSNGGRTTRDSDVKLGARGMDIRPDDGLKPKDLVGIPWRVAFALQADGWWLRSAIVWHKPNPMPESVQDRPTSAYEHVFLLSRSERYFYDAKAIAEPLATDPSENYPARATITGRGTQGAADARGNDRDKSGGFPPREIDGNGTRNARNVWTITTRPFPGAHFAVFPPELPEVCIKAGTSEKGCCPECGAPWERVVERPGDKGPTFAPLAIAESGTLPDGPGTHRNMGARYQKWLNENPKETVGWAPTCDHDHDPIPCTVLDPFAGAGTTGLVALRLRRSFIGIELSEEYATMARRRIRKNWDPGLLRYLDATGPDTEPTRRGLMKYV